MIALTWGAIGRAPQHPQRRSDDHTWRPYIYRLPWVPVVFISYTAFAH